MGRVRWWRSAVSALCAVCLLLCALSDVEAAELMVYLPETVKGYTPCEIVITSPVAGEAELKLYDPMQNLWLTRKEQVTEGENILQWDGLAEFGERSVPLCCESDGRRRYGTDQGADIQHQRDDGDAGLRPAVLGNPVSGSR